MKKWSLLSHTVVSQTRRALTAAWRRVRSGMLRRQFLHSNRQLIPVLSAVLALCMALGGMALVLSLGVSPIPKATGPEPGGVAKTAPSWPTTPTTTTNTASTETPVTALSTTPIASQRTPAHTGAGVSTPITSSTSSSSSSATPDGTGIYTKPHPTTPAPEPTSSAGSQHFTPVAPDWAGLSQQSGGYPTPTGPCTTCGSLNLVWSGGPVEAQPTVYLIFWGDHWSNQGMLSPDGQLVAQYFQDVGGTPFENILTQYKNGATPVSNVMQYGGAWIDTSAPPTDLSCRQPTVEDTSIQSEITKAIGANSWPTNGNVTFFVYTPPDVAVNSSAAGGCSSQLYLFKNAYCGYHFYLNSIGVAYAEIIYPSATSPCEWRLPQSPNGNKAADSLVNVTSHEQFEAITDPQWQVVNGAPVSSGWKDTNNNEIGDRCAWQFPSTPTHLNNGGVFEIQEEYSNATSACVSSYISPSVYAASSNGLYAFDPTSGARLWRYLAPCGVSAPAVANGIVYFGACNTVYALSAASPTVLWTVQLGGNPQSGLVISNGLLYVGGADGYIYALNATNGALVWKTAASNGSSPLVVGNGEVFATASPPYTGVLTALNANTGTQIWQKTYNNYGVNALTYDNGEVFVSIGQWNCTYSPCGGMRVYDAVTGIYIWGNSLGLSMPPAGANGVLYVPAGPSLNAYDESLGTLLWSASASPSANIGATPTIANGVAYLSLSDGTLVALDLSSKTTIWQDNSHTSQPSQAIVGDRDVFAVGGDASVYALDPLTGSVLWASKLVGSSQVTPALG